MSDKSEPGATVYKTPTDSDVNDRASCIRRLMEKGKLTKDTLRGCIFMDVERFHELELHSKMKK